MNVETRKRAIAIGLGVTLALIVAGFAVFRGFGGPEVPAGDIAVVEDAPNGTITSEELDRSMLQTARRQGLDTAPAPGQAGFDEIRDAALSNLIVGRWIDGEGEERGVEISDTELATEVERFVRESFASEREFERFKEQLAIEDQELSEQVRVNLLSTELSDVVLGPIPTDEELTVEVPEATISAYYEQNMGQFGASPLDDVREQIVDELGEVLEVQRASKVRADFVDKWRSRTFCAAGFAISRCNESPFARPEDAAPVISTRPVSPGTAGRVGAFRPRGVAQTPQPPQTSPVPGENLPVPAPGQLPDGGAARGLAPGVEPGGGQ